MEPGELNENKIYSKIGIIFGKKRRKSLDSSLEIGVSTETTLFKNFASSNLTSTKVIIGEKRFAISSENTQAKRRRILHLNPVNKELIPQQILTIPTSTKKQRIENYEKDLEKLMSVFAIEETDVERPGNKILSNLVQNIHQKFEFRESNRYLLQQIRNFVSTCQIPIISIKKFAETLLKFKKPFEASIFYLIALDLSDSIFLKQQQQQNTAYFLHTYKCFCHSLLLAITSTKELDTLKRHQIVKTIYTELNNFLLKLPALPEQLRYDYTYISSYITFILLFNIGFISASYSLLRKTVSQYNLSPEKHLKKNIFVSLFLYHKGSCEVTFKRYKKALRSFQLALSIMKSSSSTFPWGFVSNKKSFIHEFQRKIKITRMQVMRS